MSLYLLRDDLVRDTLVDLYSSFIWTERFNRIGDFELRIPPTPRNLNLFQEDRMLEINESRRVMVVENIDDSTNSDGFRELVVTGRSLEKILDERPLLPPASTGNWQINNQTPGSAIREMFQEICVDNTYRPYENLPRYFPGNLFPPDTIVESNTTITQEVEPTTLWAAMSELAEAYDFGLRLYRSEDGNLYFNAYTGRDLTATGGVDSPLVFSVELGTLTAPRSFATSNAYRNVAIIRGGGLERTYTAPGLTSTPTGFARRVLYIDYSDLDETLSLSVKQKMLQAKAMSELAKCRRVRLYDGEIDEYSPYVYGRDYELGDLVEFRKEDGAVSVMRVSEQIFVFDEQGFRSYPTLEIHSFADSGTWGSMTTEEWDDMTTQTWDSMP